jgi:hypothetical protein
MEDLTDLKNIWLTAKVDALPNAEEAIKTIKRYRFKLIVKKAATVLMLLLMTILMIYVVFYGPQVLTTRIGEIGFFIGILVLIVSNTNSLRRAFNQINRTNQEFIEYLKQTRRGRIYYYEKVQPLTFITMSLSLFLYAYELVYKNSLLMLVIYSLMTIYVVIMWFIVRPRIIEKRTKQLKETIEKLETLSK